MKKVALIYLFGSLCLLGCSVKDQVIPVPAPAPNEDVTALYQRFHGKYELISSTSNEPIDVNLDGRSSVDMVQEYDYLKEHNLEIRIYARDNPSLNRTFNFTQAWPEQYFYNDSTKERWNGEFLNYVPNLSISYAHQGAFHGFEFSPDLKQILVKLNTNENPFRWQRPESATVEAGDYIRTVNKRRVYTRAGVKEVVITTVYKRYTMTT